jgi:hypothetical protein
MNRIETSVRYRIEMQYVLLDACHSFKGTQPVTILTFVAYDRVIIKLQMYKHVFASWTT